MAEISFDGLTCFHGGIIIDLERRKWERSWGLLGMAAVCARVVLGFRLEE